MSAFANIDPALLSPWESMEAAMNATTPVSTPRRKRLRTSGPDDEPAEEETSSPPSNDNLLTENLIGAIANGTSTANATDRNQLAVAQRVGAQRRLRIDQQQALEAFVLNDMSTRQIKMFAYLLTIETKVDKIVINAPPYQVSESLTKNIVSYSLVVLLSSKIGAYKGQTPLTHMLDILKRHRFDLPAGIERNHSDWSKVVQSVKYNLTQNRSKIKKAIQASLVPDKETKLQQSIYELTRGLIANTNCSVSIPLAARVALMRAEYVQKSDHKFWDAVDARLAYLRQMAGNNPRKIQKAFDHILAIDRAKYGEDIYTLDNEVDDLQEEVDEIIGSSGGAVDQTQAAGSEEAPVASLSEVTTA